LTLYLTIISGGWKTHLVKYSLALKLAFPKWVFGFFMGITIVRKQVFYTGFFEDKVRNDFLKRSILNYTIEELKRH